MDCNSTYNVKGLNGLLQSIFYQITWWEFNEELGRKNAKFTEKYFKTEEGCNGELHWIICKISEKYILEPGTSVNN